ncbi:nucleoside-triphosphatase [Syntrophorhabdus aromaticivorans]|uniref:nucleoside-triphosphatase n=1 Tax=Syntrophorhabdus aromaticivorans TaxID=328301 RepID=UPI0004199FAD|nr:nucleoside-triphosphatase [Syntrophorhabdus aromaticivorans]
MIVSNFLVTGAPGIGKTTLIRRISQDLVCYDPAGFYTQELREDGVRVGFELVGLTGEKGLLSHADLRSPHRVGKYYVDVKGFEVFLDSLRLGDRERRLVVIDEIGRMECLSSKFTSLVHDLLAGEKVVVATVALKGADFIDEVKRRPDMLLFEITQGNRDFLGGRIIREIKPVLRAVRRDDYA